MLSVFGRVGQVCLHLDMLAAFSRKWTAPKRAHTDIHTELLANSAERVSTEKQKRKRMVFFLFHQRLLVYAAAVAAGAADCVLTGRCLKINCGKSAVRRASQRDRAEIGVCQHTWPLV